MFIDTHAHIYMDRFDEDFEEIIQRSLDAKVNQILMPNIDCASLTQVFDRAEQYPEICKPMVGLHPCSVTTSWQDQLSTLQKSINKEGVIAIGEIGIDLYWDKSLEQEQRRAFRHQIQWAKDLDLPIVIHSRNAIDITIDIVQNMQDGNLKGIFHCFDQSLEHAQKIIDVGFLMGIGGVLTYKKNHTIRDVVQQIPLDHIVLETDAPFLPPVPFRGKRNESSYIPLIAEKISELHEKSLEEIAQRTSQNALELFRL